MRKKAKLNQTVFVGVSGGVDSSIAAKRLIDQGYTVVGAFMKTWYPDWLQCDWKAERRDAMRVCARLEIPFVEYDLGQAYFEKVGRYLINEYAAGRTPNPDVMCNRHVKFDAFWQAAKNDEADLIATGHYARKGNPNEILMGIDQNKDQTYFLWGIEPSVVPNILFPVGDLKKVSVRTKAEQAGLITAEKPDSQGICFLGQVDLVEFLSHYLDLQPGKVFDTSGRQVGFHESAYVYTIGQRHGFTIKKNTTEQQTLFVIDKNVDNNTLIVGTQAELDTITSKDTINLIQTNWFTTIDVKTKYQVRYRYRQDLITGTFGSINLIKNTAALSFDTTQSSIAPGQSVVVYQDNLMIGGGIIA